MFEADSLAVIFVALICDLLLLPSLILMIKEKQT